MTLKIGYNLKTINFNKKMENQSFKELVEKMEALQEDEQGQLKGGIATLDAKSSDLIDPNGNCGNCG